MDKNLKFAVILVWYSTAFPAIAVDADLYSLDDFIDPRILGYDFSDDDGDYQHGSSLVIANARFGSAHNYQQREIFTESNSNFAQFDIYWYYNAMQLGYRFHRFESDFDEPISQQRHKIFAGLYALHGENRPVSRYLLTLEQSDFEGKHADELGIDLDQTLPYLTMPDWFIHFNGGISFRHREQEGENETRILLRFSAYDFYDERVTVRFSTGITEIDDEWDAAITKLAISAYQQIWDTTPTELHAYYALSYRPERNDTDNRENHEFGIFINIPLVL